MTTQIDTLDGNSECLSDSEDEQETLVNTILDASKPVEDRIAVLEQYYDREDMGDNTIEILSTLAGMYQMSGSTVIEQLMYRICSHSHLSAFLKLEAAKSILGYSDMASAGNDQSDRDAARKALGFRAVDYVCYDPVGLATPCRIEAIMLLMSCDTFRTNTVTYLQEFAQDDTLECEFRYRTILSIENKILDGIRADLIDRFNDKELVKELYGTLKSTIKCLMPSIKRDVADLRVWRTIVHRLPYSDLSSFYSERFPDSFAEMSHFIYEAQRAFFSHAKNQTFYRTLAGQYLLQKCQMNVQKIRTSVEEQLMEFATDEDLDHNRRADAADVLLHLGSAPMQSRARDIITALGLTETRAMTIFENAQNVHTEKVEESVADILGFLVNVPVQKVHGSPIDFEYVNGRILSMLDEEKKLYEREGSDKQYKDRHDKIRLALNRISMDRVLYSKFNSSLSNILIKVWTYIASNTEHKEEMTKRLLEELEEMSGTCSTGFATRLVNTISGFGEFNIMISWEEQITANFAGRLNAAARRITDVNSVFRTEKLDDMVGLWLYRPANAHVRREIEQSIGGQGTLSPEAPQNSTDHQRRALTLKSVIDAYLETDRDTKIERCIEEFGEAVLSEMTLLSSRHAERQHFSLFFRTNVSRIREELYAEFKDLIDDTSFDLYFRKSIMNYEN